MDSIVDSKNRICVDCAECTRGGNGKAKHKCAAGWQTKKPMQGGCFTGTIMPKYKKELKTILQGE